MSPIRRLLAVIAAGLALGAVTQLLQGILPGPLAMLANGLSPWLIAAFVAGALMPAPRWAVLAPPLMLLAALAGYYLAVELRFGYGGSKSSLIFWTVASVIGGPIFGAGGWSWRRAARPRVRGIAAGLLGGLLLMEAFYLPLTAGYGYVAPLEAAVAVLVPVALGRTWRERLIGVAASIPWGLAGIVALIVLASLQLALAGVQ